jgi:hypothetical protein
MPLEFETVETLEAAALQLTPADRARLVERLIATLDADPEVEEAWASEVERRASGNRKWNCFFTAGSRLVGSIEQARGHRRFLCAVSSQRVRAGFPLFK